MKPVTPEQQRYYRGIGWRTAVLRQRAKLSQAEAAKLAGTRPATWRRLEAGEQCRYSTICLVAKNFQCSISWLLIGVEGRDEAFELLANALGQDTA